MADRVLHPVPRVPAQLRLSLLGGFRLTVDDAAVELPGGTQRLVAVLALRGRVSRNRLAGMLWTRTTEHRALASLRTVIWRVNQAAPELVVCMSGSMDLGADVEVDLHRLRAAAFGVLGGESAQAAAALVPGEDGDLLPEWEDEWLLADRERVRQLRLHMLEALAGRLTRDGRYGLALEAALAALQADILRESAHRAVIAVHLAEGNVMEAGRAYDSCRDVLQREVGVRPSAATRSLVESAGLPG